VKKQKKLCDNNEELINYLESVMKTIPPIDNPTSLDQYNYHYNEQGKLVNIDTGKPFHWVNQRHYDCLGDIIVKHIQLLLVQECDLIEVFLPLETDVESKLYWP